MKITFPMIHLTNPPYKLRQALPDPCLICIQKKTVIKFVVLNSIGSGQTIVRTYLRSMNSGNLYLPCNSRQLAVIFFHIHELCQGKNWIKMITLVKMNVELKYFSHFTILNDIWILGEQPNTTLHSFFFFEGTAIHIQAIIKFIYTTLRIEMLHCLKECKIIMWCGTEKKGRIL